MSLFSELDGVRQQSVEDLTAAIDTLLPGSPDVQRSAHIEINSVITQAITRTLVISLGLT
jgi:hypothetical protein